MSIIKKPIITEKMTDQSEKYNRYAFVVDRKVNKKVKRLARKSALSYKAKDKNIIVLEDFAFDQASTKSYRDLLSNFDLLDNKTVLVVAESNKNIFLSSRNLKKTRVVLASELNTYDVLSANKLMIMASSINEIEKNF